MEWEPLVLAWSCLVHRMPYTGGRSRSSAAFSAWGHLGVAKGTVKLTVSQKRSSKLFSNSFTGRAQRISHVGESKGQAHDRHNALKWALCSEISGHTPPTEPLCWHPSTSILFCSGLLLRGGGVLRGSFKSAS